jgi:hypothetical protein
MELNEYIIYEIMKLESDDSTSLMNGLNKLKDIKVDLLQTEDYKLFYQTSIKDILNTDLDGEDIIYLRNGGWELSEDKKYIVKFLSV